MQFKNRVALVTGSSKGLGREVALEFARKGAKVVVNGRNPAKVANVAREIEDMGGTALGIAADVTKKAEVVKLVQRVLEKLGRVDILVNNAGGSNGAQKAAELTEEDWDRIIALNLKSTFLCSQAVIPAMKNQQYGKIVNVSSQAGRALSVLGGPHYASAKAGVIGLTRHLAKELAQEGINVNAVAPGLICSSQRFENLWYSYPKDVRDKFLDDIPIGRLATNKEVAAAALFLASEEASYFVGATLDVNGGRWMV